MHVHGAYAFAWGTRSWRQVPPRSFSSPVVVIYEEAKEVRDGSRTAHSYFIKTCSGGRKRTGLVGARLVAARQLPKPPFPRGPLSHHSSPSQTCGNYPLKCTSPPQRNTRGPSFVRSFGPARPSVILTHSPCTQMLSLSPCGELLHVPPEAQIYHG